MKLKKVLSICKTNGLYYLYDRIDRSGEITQWLGDGYALYPLDGLPILDEESFCAVFDITGKQREKILFRHERLPEPPERRGRGGGRQTGSGVRNDLYQWRVALEAAENEQRRYVHSEPVPFAAGRRYRHGAILRADHAARAVRTSSQRPGS